MPELPVMQALAERLDAGWRGSEIASVTLVGFAVLKTVSPPIDSLTGRTVVHVGRRGKFCVVDVGDGVRLALHLSQAGRIVIEDPPKTTRPKGVLARVCFVDRPAWVLREYGTERKAGLWMLGPGDDGPLAALGPEPDSAAFAELVRTGDDRRRLSTLLRDQHTVAGIGRGHTDDILQRARLSPMRALAALDADERERLLAAVAVDLSDKLDAERQRDGGLPPKLGEHWRVHARYGEPCPDCATPIARVSFENYELCYCPQCQTDGRELSDRRLSRLLK